MPGAHHDAVQVAHVTIADEHLPAIEDVVISVPDGSGRDTEDMPARLRLRDRDCGQAASVRDDRQPGLLLDFVAKVQDFRHTQLGSLHHGAHGATDPRQLLDDDGLRQVSQAHPPVVAADGYPEPALTRDQPRQVMLDLLRRLHIWYARPYRGLGKGSNLLA